METDGVSYGERTDSSFSECTFGTSSCCFELSDLYTMETVRVLEGGHITLWIVSRTLRMDSVVQGSNVIVQ